MCRTPTFGIAECFQFLLFNGRDFHLFTHLEDLAFIVDRSVEVETLIPFILKTGKPLLKRVQLFDVYQGKGMEVGKKVLDFP